ncbi:MAG TPA: alpha-ketoacid dehydrogenase subunit beta [Pseudonocardia sp.]
MTVKRITYAAAINDALRIEMERDPTVFLLGEDIGKPGGIYTVTRGLYDQFGAERVMDTPIAEAGFVGLATGAAAAGLRPVVEIMFVEFMLVAADQIMNQAAKLHFLSGGQITVPLTIRTQQGIVGGGGAQHSQSLESVFASVPGLSIALPYTPADAKGLIATAIRSDEPTLVIEHKGLYFTKGDVPEGEHLVPFGKAAVRRAGDDVTLVGFSRSVEWCLQAAEQLADKHGVSAEVVDLRSIVPLDVPTLVESVGKTGRCVVVQEAPGSASTAGQVASIVTEQCWSELRAPVARVTGLDMPVPYAKTLEDVWRPSSDDVIAAALHAVGEPAASSRRDRTTASPGR